MHYAAAHEDGGDMVDILQEASAEDSIKDLVGINIDKNYNVITCMYICT